MKLLLFPGFLAPNDVDRPAAKLSGPAGESRGGSVPSVAGDPTKRDPGRAPLPAASLCCPFLLSLRYSISAVIDLISHYCSPVPLIDLSIQFPKS